MLFKKIVSIFLAATIMLSMLALTVNAESVQNTEIFKVEVEAVSAASTVSSNPVIFNNGEEITVNVFASQNTGFTMLRMIIDFNENFLEAVDGKFSSTDIYSDEKLSLGEGFFEFSSFADFSVKTATGLLATITFVAKEDVCFTEDEFNASEIIKVYPYENNNGFCVNADFEELPLVSEVVPFAVHEISSGVVTNPTCLDEGYTTYHCELCDKDIVGNITDAAGHTPADKPVVENYVDPTCTVEGSYDDVIYCTICSAELSRTAMVVEPLGHDLVPHDSKAPTCTEIGWDTYNACSRCDYTTYVELSALGHNCEAVWYKDNNEHWHICSVCDDRADVAGHIYNGDYICDECDFGNVNIAEIFPDTQNDAWYSDAVAYAYSRGILMGYQGGEFGVSDGIQRQDFLVMLARFDGVDLADYGYDCTMPDVARDSYYEAAVNWGVEKGITTGYMNGKFGVGDMITREQIVTFLYRYAKYKNIDVENVTDTKAKAFPDYNTVTDFAEAPIIWAIDKGVINGKSGYIAPQGNAQRCEIAQIMYNIFQKDIF